MIEIQECCFFRPNLYLANWTKSRVQEIDTKNYSSCWHLEHLYIYRLVCSLFIRRVPLSGDKPIAWPLGHSGGYVPLPHKARSKKFSNKIRAFDDISLVPRPIFGGRGENRAWYTACAYTGIPVYHLCYGLG